MSGQTFQFVKIQILFKLFCRTLMLVLGSFLNRFKHKFAVRNCFLKVEYVC